MNLIIILSLIVGWFVIAVIIAMVFGFVCDTIRERSRTQHTLEYGDTYMQVCVECGFDQGGLIGIDRCVACGCVHR